MSGYRALAGFGKLKRNNGEAAWDLPTSGGTKVSPTTIFGALGTYLDGGKTKWERFGAGCDFSVTIERNVNFHNDIGIRTYTVATTGMLEPDFTINGFVSAEYLNWLIYALNMEAVSSTTSDGVVTEIYHYAAPIGPQMFDIGYVQSNSHTNEYGGADEFHILAGCAIDTAKFSYELGSDAGVKFSIEGKALMDWFSLTDNAGDVNPYFEDIPSDVFSTGCVSTSTDDSTYTQVAQTDSAEITIQNFLERRGQCLANWGSGYSMGTLNFEINTTTYSNDPKKYELEVYGYPASAESTLSSTIYNPQKVPYQIPYMLIMTDNSSSPGANDATKAFKLKCTDVIATRMEKSYASESAIMDSPTLRGKDLTITVQYGGTITDNIRSITYVLNGGVWDADAGDRPTQYDMTSSAPVTLPASTVISKANKTFGGWYTTSTFSGSEITQFTPTDYVNGITVYAKWS